MTHIAVKPTNPTRSLLLAFLAPLVIGSLASGCAEGVTTDPPPNTCGDGVQAGDEACDDGDENGDAPDACRADCTKPRCGDGIVDRGEACDDANEEGGDGCVACEESYVCGDDECSKDQGESCSLCADDCCPCGDGECSLGEVCGQCPQDCCVLCGNGELDAGEGCDDGNNVDGDGCAKGCTDEDGAATCGNAIIETGEGCDDGNTTAADGCGGDCQLEYVCGDGICEKDVGETCLTCLSDCCPNCGDGVVNDFEDCDGSVPPGVPTCEDQCYPGGTPSCTTCTLDYGTCTGDLPECGNGAIECGEQCDDQDLDGLDCETLGYAGGNLRCTSTCELDTAQCGELLHYYRQDFDAGCPADWVVNFPWQCGVPAGGPGEPQSPPNVMSTGLAGNYTPNSSPFTAHITSPSFNLSAAVNPAVTFAVWHDFGTGDGIQVLASTDGTNFTAISEVNPPYSGGTVWTGRSDGWRTYSAVLSQYAGEDQVWVRFGLQSDSSVSGFDGAFVDDVLVSETCGNGIVDSGELCDGESFAAGSTCPDGTCGLPTCAADCQSFDVDSCITPDCGNDVRECAEQCDGSDFGGDTCDLLGYDGGNLSCSAQCQRNVNQCGDLLVLLPEQSFETCPPAGWTFAGVWECGVPTSGPGTANTGTRVAATNLEGDYANNHTYATDYVQTPAFPVNGPAPTLAFSMWLQTESCCDGLHVEVSTNGTTWTLLDTVSPAYTGTIGGQPAWNGARTTWAQYTASLAAYAGQQVRIRFSFRSDTSAVYPGAYIDDVVAVPDPGYLPFTIAATDLGVIDTMSGLAADLDTVPSALPATWTIVSNMNGGWITINPATGVLSGMPSAANVGPGSVTVRATSNAVPSNFEEVVLPFTVAEAVYSEDFEPCPAGWTYTGDWECGDPTSGPAATHSGVNAVGTNTYSSSRAWGSSVATSAAISLAGTTNPRLSYWFWQDGEPNWDCTQVQISVNGGAFTPLTTSLAYEGNEGGQACWDDDYTTWTQVNADLSAYVGQSIRLQWSMYTDSSGTYPGPFVDDVVVTSE